MAGDREPPNSLSVMVRHSRGSHRASFGFRRSFDGSAGEVELSVGQADGLPAFVLACTTPNVIALKVELDDGSEEHVELSAVHPRFGLRFGALPIPDGATMVAVHADTAAGTRCSGGSAFAAFRELPPAAGAGWEPTSS